MVTNVFSSISPKYRFSQLVLVAGLLTPAVTGWTKAVADAAAEQHSWQRLISISDSILEHHIDPPTRQEMILAAVKQLYRASQKNRPARLSRRISKLTGKQEISEYLDEVAASFEGETSDKEAVMIQGLLSIVPAQPRLVPTAEARVQSQLAANRYVGTGIVLSVDEKTKRPAIPRAFYGGPAWNAGIRSGDVIMAIDGASTEKMGLARVVKLLRGSAGTKVVMTIQSPSSDAPRDLPITRGVAFIPTVEGYRQLSEPDWDYFVDAPRKIAYVRINRIGSSTLHELKKIEQKLRRNLVEAIMLDLRYGGGILHDVVMVADALIDEGPIGGMQSADSVKRYHANKTALFNDMPMAVLVDRFTQPDREFLAAALQDTRGAKIIGGPTPGAAFVRTAIELPGGAEQLILAIGLLTRVDGTVLLRSTGNLPHQSQPPRTPKPEAEARQPGGVIPDHLVEVGVDKRQELIRANSITKAGAVTPVDDPVLNKAVKVLERLLSGTASPATGQ